MFPKEFKIFTRPKEYPTASGYLEHSEYLNYITPFGCILTIKAKSALFLYFILIKNSTCFGQTYCPSSGVLILYSQQLVYVILSVSEVRILTSLADRQHH